MGWSKRLLPGKNISLVTCFFADAKKEESRGSMDCWEKSAFIIIDYTVSFVWKHFTKGL